MMLDSERAKRCREKQIKCATEYKLYLQDR